MDLKDTPESEMPDTELNPGENKTGRVHDDAKKIEPSPLKKNEFALILFGALLLTVVIFFLFFRSTDTGLETEQINPSGPSLTELENRVELLENALENLGENGGISNDATTDIGPVKERVTSLETAFFTKFDSLQKRMEAIEKRISGPKKKSVAAAVSKPSAPAKKKKITNLFHTIKKGETLYSISKKYKTTVTKIRELNKLSPDAKIYPGDSILVQ